MVNERTQYDMQPMTVTLESIERMWLASGMKDQMWKYVNDQGILLYHWTADGENSEKHFNITVDGAKRNLQHMIDLFFKVDVWWEDEQSHHYIDGVPIWMSVLNDKIKEAAEYRLTKDLYE